MNCRGHHPDDLRSAWASLLRGGEFLLQLLGEKEVRHDDSGHVQ